MNKPMSTTELRLRLAHLLHRLTSNVMRIKRGETIEEFEINAFHDDIYKLLEHPDL